MDLSQLPGLWSLTPLGLALGLVALITLSIVRGWLIPKATHDGIVAASNKRGDEWKETALELRGVNSEIRDQNSKLIEANKVVEAFLRSAGPHQGDTTQPVGGG